MMSCLVGSRIFIFCDDFEQVKFCSDVEQLQYWSPIVILNS